MNILFRSSNNPKATDVAKVLKKKYGIQEFQDSKVGPDTLVIALGGDGFMLNVLQDSITRGYSTYGVNCGNVGFLLNSFNPSTLESDILHAVPHKVKVLKIDITCLDLSSISSYAINDFYVLRNCVKAAKLKVSINGKTVIPSLAGDGIIISTPLGSTAYCLAAGGSILPLDSNNMCLVPINPCIPRSNRPAILTDDSLIEIEILEHDKRTVLVAADSSEIKNTKKAIVSIDKTVTPILFLKKGETISEKILMMQFHK